MPPRKPVRIYWDSDVFLACFNKEPSRVQDFQKFQHIVPFPIQEPRPHQLCLLPR